MPKVTNLVHKIFIWFKMESNPLPLEVDDEGHALAQHQGSSTGSGSSSGTGYYGHKNGM